MKSWLPIFGTLLVLGVLGVDKWLLRASATVADGYHIQVRGAADLLPYHFGSWLGVDVPVSAGARKLLRPNVLISRQYTNIQTGESVQFLFVQVRDARDILGHYPPVCYPGQGWVMDSSERVEWQGADRHVNGTRYRMSRAALEGAPILIDNFLLLPDGTTCPDMNAVESAAQDRLRKLFGATQVQVLYDASVLPHRQRVITQEFIQFSGPLIDAASSGEIHVAQ